MTTTNQVSIQQYLSEVRQLSVLVARGEALPDDLQRLITKYLQRSEGDSVMQHFLHAEQAFYDGRYEGALRDYLAAKGVPHHQYYCYRASAFVYRHLGHHDKALAFGKKALALDSNDERTLRLCAELAQAAGHLFEAEQYKKRLLELTDPSADLPPYAESAVQENERLESVALRTEEFEELNNIFRQDDFEEPDEEESSFDDDESQVEVVQNAPEPKPTHQVDSGDHQHALIINYLSDQQRRSGVQEDRFFVLNGWNEDESARHVTGNSLPTWLTAELLTEGPRATSGGYFLRWQGKGIVINPGHHFLRHFHRQGLTLHDIDHVIVTRADPESYAEVRAIYMLNARLNQALEERHLIHYFLNRQAYQVLAPSIKPHFRQEADAVHSLELYLDSPECERFALSEFIALNYFTGVRDGDSSTLGIRLDLYASNEENSTDTDAVPVVSVGYVSGMPWSPFLANRLGNCDLLIVGLDYANRDNSWQQGSNELSLAYEGALSLAQEVGPRIFVCSEFNGQEGDIRLEVVKRLRRDLGNQAKEHCAILPGDNGLVIDLTTLAVRCSVSGSLADASKVKVIKSKDAFGQLQYVCPCSWC